MSEFVFAFKGESGGWNEEKWAYQYPEVCPVLGRHVFVLLRTDVMVLQLLINIKNNLVSSRTISSVAQSFSVPSTFLLVCNLLLLFLN